MRTGVCSSLKPAAALAVTGIIAGGCADLPSVRGVSEVSLSVSTTPLASPRVAVRGESSLAPGDAARSVLPAPGACDGIAGIACVVQVIVAVPVAAIVGATAKTSQKLPLEQAEALNRVTFDVASQLNLVASFRTALNDEAQQRGVALNAANSDAEILIVARLLSWDIKSGNRVAVKMDINVTLRRGDEQGTHTVTYRGPARKVEAWTADSGQAIRQTLEQTMIEASRKVWDQILGHRRGAT